MATETPNTVHGRLLEAVHISGYSFERACTELEWLLDEGRWRTVGSGFDDVNKFLDSIKLDTLRVAAEQRQRIARRIKELQPQASNRAIARTLGSSEPTIRRDTASNDTPYDTKPKQNTDEVRPRASNDAPVPSTGGAEAARVLQKVVDKAVKADERREERLDRIAEISKGNTVLSTAVRYPIIYADPPWRYENPPIGASNRSIENHYPTMTLEEICALPVRDLATDDALLYLWATSPKMAECFRVIEAWGFEYRTDLVWDKEVIGMGYHARNQHETLLIAKRGSIPPPKAGTQPSSVHRERRGEHSAKPAFYYEMIEAAYPQLPKIELFCRSPRNGWAVWGNQSGDE